jgi:hypothetical protein
MKRAVGLPLPCHRWHSLPKPNGTLQSLPIATNRVSVALVCPLRTRFLPPSSVALLGRSYASSFKHRMVRISPLPSAAPAAGQDSAASANSPPRSHLPRHYQPRPRGEVSVPLKERLRMLGNGVLSVVMHPLGLFVTLVVFIGFIAGGDTRARQRKVVSCPFCFAVVPRSSSHTTHLRDVVLPCTIYSRQAKQELVDSWKEEHDRPLRAAAAVLHTTPPTSAPPHSPSPSPSPSQSQE